MRDGEPEDFDKNNTRFADAITMGASGDRLNSRLLFITYTILDRLHGYPRQLEAFAEFWSKRYGSSMTISDQYRHAMHLRYPDQEYAASAKAIPFTDSIAFLRRENTSHRGIGDHKQLQQLCAFNVDQSFLEEICELEQLVHLELGWRVIAKDLAPLKKLRSLRYLAIDTTSVTDFAPLLELPALDSLFIVNAKRLSELTWLQPLKRQLRVLGLEGSISNTQNIASLKPLDGFELEALFLTSTRLADKDLSVILTMPKLRLLETAATVPKADFMALKAAKPQLSCNWFAEKKWQELERLKAAAKRPKTRA